MHKKHKEKPGTSRKLDCLFFPCRSSSQHRYGKPEVRFFNSLLANSDQVATLINVLLRFFLLRVIAYISILCLQMFTSQSNFLRALICPRIEQATS